MSRKFKKHYDNFNRHILAEFMSPESLDEMDKKYTEAKIKRMEDRIKKEVEESE